MPEHILLVDDDERLAEMLLVYLKTRGFDASHRASGTSGLAAALTGSYDAVILDVMMPDLDGLEVCRQLRAQSQVPILMLTARGDDLDRIVGLELGADDYLPKPFNPRELLARLTAVLRRTRGGAKPEGNVLRFGHLVIDKDARTVFVGNERADLTGRQFDLLWLLASRAGRVQSREQIMEALGVGEFDSSVDRSIDVHISRIRSAIEEDPKQPRFVQTVRGAGYVFSPPRRVVGT